MLSKQQILENRNKLRGLVKTAIVKTVVQNKPEQERPEDHATKLQRRDSMMRQRRISQDLSIFESPFGVRDVYINGQFHELFKIEEKLGEGAQSIVKKCMQISTGKQFAVKIFRRSDCELISTLKSQYKILKALDHPNIIRAHNLFISERQLSSYLLLDYWPHPQLKQYLDNNGRLQEQQVSNIIMQVLLAVSYMHEKKVCHRDIKPHNMLYDTLEQKIKLIDFDISKMNGRRRNKLEMWTMTGTVYYKAPEMFAGKYDEGIDLWSVGVTAYELMTGRLPFIKEYLNDTIEDIKHAEPEFPSYLSQFARDFVKRCLVKNPAKRITAKQALSCPFIIQCQNGSVLSSPNQDKLNQSFEARGRCWMMDQQDEFTMEIQKCYQDDDVATGGFMLDGRDIGVRCFEAVSSAI